MAVTWVTSLIGGFAPLTVLAVIVRTEDCSPWLLGLISAVVRHGVNVDAAFLAVVHIIIVPAPSPFHSPVHDFLIPTVLSCLFNCNCHTDLFEEFKTLSTSSCVSLILARSKTSGFNDLHPVIGSVHIIIVVLGVSIYIRMSIIRAEMTPFRFAHDMRTEHRAGVTIVILLLTLNVTFCCDLETASR